MATLQGGIAPYPVAQFFDDEGVPLAFGKLYSYLAGTATPSPVYTTHLLDVAHANPAILDAAGRIAFYLGHRAYKLVLNDSNDNPIWERDQVANVAEIFLQELGLLLVSGATGVTSGYTVLPADNLVRVNSSGGASPCIINLESAVDRKFPIIIKNMGTIALAVTPQGGQSVDGVVGPYTVPPAASPLFPSIMLISDGISDYSIIASHGIA